MRSPNQTFIEDFDSGCVGGTQGVSPNLDPSPSQLFGLRSTVRTSSGKVPKKLKLYNIASIILGNSDEPPN